MKQILIFSAFAALALAASARQWQTGKVLDYERNSYFAGSIGSTSTSGTATATATGTGPLATASGTYQGSTLHSNSAIYRVYQNYVIEGDQYVYLASERLRWRWSKPADLTVNGTVQYVVEKRKLIVLDDGGKEHELEIVKRILKETSK
jgi:hypothetical protein